MDDTDEDRAAIQPLVNQVMVYPLEQFTGEMRTKDWADVPSFDAGPGAGRGETKWVVPDAFLDQFREALQSVPPQAGEEALHAQFTGCWTPVRLIPGSGGRRSTRSGPPTRP
jgi:hypothetical protein